MSSTPLDARTAPSLLSLVLALGLTAPASQARAAPGDLPVPAGWYAGDLHVHWPDDCWGVASPESIFAAMPADLSVTSVLIWGAGDHFEPDVQAYFRGRVDAPVSTPERIVHYDLEVSAFGLADHLGHLGGLNLEEIDFPPAGYAGPIQDWAHAQEATIGTLHCQSWWPWYYNFPPPNTCCIPYELPVDVALGRVDYLDYQGPVSHGWQFIWYHLLNCGFRVPMIATSDSNCLYDIGEFRTYAQIDDALSYQSFMDAIAAGRTVTVEQMQAFVDFRIGGTTIGGEVTAALGEELLLIAHAYLPEAQHVTGSLEILRNGQRVVWRDYSQTGGVVTVYTTVQAGRSAWFAARTQRSHTAPIYLVVGGQPIRTSEVSADYLLRYLNYLEASVVDGYYPHLTPEDEAALIADIATARGIYETILDETLAQIAIWPDDDPTPGAPTATIPLRLWPNPFVHTVHVEMPDDRPPIGAAGAAAGAAADAESMVRIHGADGRLLRQLRPERAAGGVATAIWDGRDAAGRDVPSGVYYVTVPGDPMDARVGRVARVVRVR